MTRKAILILVLVALIFSAGAIAAPAKASTTTAQITGYARSKANLRAGPSTRTQILMKLTRHQTIIILGASKAHRWLKIQTAKGETGWVISFLVRLNDKVKLRSVQVVPY